MESNKRIFSTNNEFNNYNSLVDEFRRTKTLYKNKIFSIAPNYLFEILKQVLKKTFKFSVDIKQDLKFNLRIKNVNTSHNITEYDEENKLIEIFWSLDNDIYFLTFKVRKSYMNNKKSVLKIKQSVTRNKTFFGLQDLIGLHLYKKSFKLNSKSIIKSVFFLLKENKYI